ncbi:zinc finger protein 180 isoform X6 [Sciurus carolinensis]|uniref:zinc finger protein 180 isoform X6 n=1 Tax=Sciurus carolinensis TaxID=30640 RepID=UPI001FB2E3C8|nr:zinc finger protein 180 isoform X6 [Sciurus carolinensis]
MCTDSGEIQRRPVPPMLYLFSGGLDSVQVDEVLNCRFCFLREGLCHCPCTLEQVLSRKQVQFSTLPCLEHSMEGQDEKPPGPLKACTQDSLLPQEIIIKVEGEDAGSLTIPSQEEVNFKIVTVDFTHEEQGTWNPTQGIPDRSVILENHRNLVSWGCLTLLSSRLGNCTWKKRIDFKTEHF